METVQENSDEDNESSSTTKKNNDILSSWFVDHVSVQSAEFDMEF